MSTDGDAVDGAMVVIGDRCYFIPREELRSYRLPDDVASSVLGELGDEVSGYSFEPTKSGVFGVKFDTGYKPSKVGPKSPVQFSGIINHCITIVTN